MTTTKRWPLKADYHKLTRADGIALVNTYASFRGLQSLRKHLNFRTMSFLDPVSFGRHDLYCALQVLLDEVNAAPDDEHMTKLGEQLRERFGSLDKPIALTVLGRGKARDSFVIEPQAWINSPLH